MGQPRTHDGPPDGPLETADVIDFDDAVFDAWSPEIRQDLMAEARLLAGVFAPDGQVEAMRRMAAQLSAGERDGEMGRAHARKLAAALKRLAIGG